jgi:hypothetical protein
MNILRQPPFPLSVSYSGLNPDEEYIMQIYDDYAKLVETYDVTADGSGVVTQELGADFARYDATFSLYIYSKDVLNEADEIVVVDTLYIYRPYTNPLDLAETEGEYDTYIMYERTARQIIDMMTGGFYYESSQIETLGSGADILPVSKRINRINYVYKNNLLDYNRFDLSASATQDTYFVTPDHTAISIAVGYEISKLQHKNVQLPIAASDSFMLFGDNYDSVNNMTEYRGLPLFPEKYTYVIYGEFGWPVVPQDIQDATKMLIDDIKCNKITYINRYISEYQTDQFRVKYNDLATSGTGNMIVDKLLSKYATPITKLGVL